MMGHLIIMDPDDEQIQYNVHRLQCILFIPGLKQCTSCT